MSEVTVTRCDKCEKFEEKTETTIVKLYSPVEDDKRPPHDFDVCDKCLVKLLKWFGVEA